MAQIKAHEFDALAAKGRLTLGILLVYGPDRGLVSERAARLAGLAGVDLDDAFSVVRLDAGELQGDAGRLLDEANALGLFGGDRLIWVRNAGNERGLIEALGHLLKDPPPATTLLIEAGDLKKGSALRKEIEDSRAALAVPCYADEARTIHALIDEEMAKADLRISGEARHLLTTMLGGDRLASRGELQKLALYCRGQDVVSEEDVITIIGDAAALSVDDAVDAVLNGDVTALDLALERIIASKSQIFLVLQSCLRQFQMLAAMRTALEQERQPAATVIATLGRRIHFKRKPAIEKALRVWTAGAIDQALNHLQAAVLETRRRPALEESLARQALLALALRSARAAR